MAIAFDAATESATFTTTSPHTFSHTPVGTPRGVIVGTVQSASSAVLVTAVSYGGVAMTRMARGVDTSGEPGGAALWFLGEGIPAGMQTVSITHTATSVVKWAGVATVTAAADTEIGVGGFLSDGATNPQVIIGKQSGMSFGALFSGHDDVSSFTPLAGTETIFSEDFGTDVGFFFRESAAGSGTVAVGYTAGAEDGGVAVVSVIEKVAGVRMTGATVQSSVALTTTVLTDLAGDVSGHDLYTFAVSRDHTSGTALPTCTDNSAGNAWTLVSNDTDRQLLVWWKKGVAGDQGARVTVAGCVGSATGGVFVVKGAAAGNPTTDLTVEANASGDETHASITPTNPSSLVVFGVADVANDTNTVTALAAATLGTMEPEVFERLSTGGSDCRITVTATQSPGGPNATGNFTWTQLDSTTKSVAFAISTLAFTATGASTLDGVTSAGSGTFIEAITGTGASTLAGVTSAGTGVVANPITGTGASTLAGVSSAGTGVFTGTGPPPSPGGGCCNGRRRCCRRDR